MNKLADFDVRNDTTPELEFDQPHKPTIAALKAALTTFSATSYPTDRLNTMTYNDLIYAARVHDLSVVGL